MVTQLRGWSYAWTRTCQLPGVSRIHPDHTLYGRHGADGQPNYSLVVASAHEERLDDPCVRSDSFGALAAFCSVHVSVLARSGFRLRSAPGRRIGRCRSRKSCVAFFPNERAWRQVGSPGLLSGMHLRTVLMQSIVGTAAYRCSTRVRNSPCKR